MASNGNTNSSKDKGKSRIPTFGLNLETAVVVALIGAGVALIGDLIGLWSVFLTRTPPTPVPTPITSKYSFEEGEDGWVKQEDVSSTACIDVFQSNDYARDGRFSLAMQMELQGGSPDDPKTKGEAWVDVGGPINLKDQTITAWVYAPNGAVGDPDKPNGLQLFVKDENGNSEYGKWKNVSDGDWNELSLTVSNPAVDGAEIFNIKGEFDPTQIVIIGVKMGGGSGSTAVYNGPIYIDMIDW